MTRSPFAPRLLCMALACCSLGHAQAPSFDAAGVQQLSGDRRFPLAPGVLVSIYGRDLGPPGGCRGDADTQRRETPNPQRPNQSAVELSIYPKELCGTRVLVGGIPAGLLYVHAGQINFKVPQETPLDANPELTVIYKGRRSGRVTLPVEMKVPTVSLESPSSVGMPVWIKVAVPRWRGTIQYPFDIWPADFKCHELEVRRDGKLLPRIATLFTQAFNGGVLSGPLCGSLGLPAPSRHMGRIPLHLQYRLDRPGIYEVRYVTRPQGPGVSEIPLTSAWTPIEIRPAGPRDRARWLDQVSAKAPTSVVDLLTDFLPGILGIPDEQSLRLLLPYLHHPDSLVRRFAMYGLTYWPADRAAAGVSQLVLAKGPSDASIEFLIARSDSAAGDASIVAAAIPHLRSDSAVLLRGAVTAVARMAPRVSARVRTRAETAMLEAANHIVASADPQTVTDYVSALGLLKDDRASAVLWDLVNRQVAYGQAMLALTWRHSPSDLPKLAELALSPARGPNADYELSSLPYALRRAYGDSALPYLETLLQRSGFTRVRTASARELILANRRSGFAFAVDAIERGRPYRAEIVEFVKGQFPELRPAGDDALLRFLKTR